MHILLLILYSLLGFHFCGVALKVLMYQKHFIWFISPSSLICFLNWLAGTPHSSFFPTLLVTTSVSVAGSYCSQSLKIEMILGSVHDHIFIIPKVT